MLLHPSHYLEIQGGVEWWGCHPLSREGGVECM